MTLQAFIDDSGSEPNTPVFVLAGYIAPESRWSNFVEEWRAALAKPPGAEYFKASEAMSLRGAFSSRNGWDDQARDERVVELAEIIWRNCTVGVSASLRHRDWDDTLKVLAEVVPSKRLSHPYNFLAYTMLSELWLHPTKLTLGKAGPCDFYFDRQLGFENDATALWHAMREAINMPRSLPDHLRNWIRTAPTFVDDKSYLQLQAADLCAWANRRASVHDANDLKLPPMAVERLCALPVMHLNVPREHLVRRAREAFEFIRSQLHGASDRNLAPGGT
jgi:hypothetical protein